MLPELLAIKSALSTALSAMDASVAIGIGDMTGSLPPFVSVWSGPGGLPVDPAAGGPMGDYSGRVGVTFTAARADAALAMAGAGIAALSPNRRRARLAAAGRVAWIEFYEARTIQIDRDVTLTATNSHPAYVVVLFDVHSSPAPTEEA